MSTAFPLVPLHGSSPTVYLLMAAFVGLTFGWFLERSGFGSAKKLTAVFTMRDWQVYRVMFTAVLTAMIGAQILGAMGILELGALELSTTYIWPMFFGGILFGVGFYFGGFCPGTAVVSMVRGRLDALVFLVGIVFGIYGFALFFDGAGQASWFQNFYAPSSATILSLTGSSYAWIWAIGISAGVIVTFRYLYIFEQRFAMLTPEQLDKREARPAVFRPRAGRTTRAAVALTAVMALILGVLQFGSKEPAALAIGSEVPAAVAVDSATVPVVDPLSLAEWIVSDANRIAEDSPPNCHVLDLRTAPERASVPIRGTLVVPTVDDREQQYDATVALLDNVLTPADKNKPLVIVDGEGSSAGSDLVADLRVQGLNALLLDGGSTAWQETILQGDAVWPEWVVNETPGVDAAASVPTMASYRDQVRSWMAGESHEIPAYLAIPGTVQLPSEVATVAATGGGGGGCG